MAGCIGKKRYRNNDAAARAASGAMMRKIDPPDFLRAYRCQKCKGWHLTSQPYDPDRRNAKRNKIADQLPTRAGRPPAVDNKAAGKDKSHEQDLRDVPLLRNQRRANM